MKKFDEIYKDLAYKMFTLTIHSEPGEMPAWLIEWGNVEHYEAGYERILLGMARGPLEALELARWTMETYADGLYAHCLIHGPIVEECKQKET